ncbi:phage holin family protein, partial [Enterococcus faecalis]|uniref:phage holin family protein n=4 Tax=cellular organisms TaxID=131567 RepID=UPI003CCC50E2
MLEDKTGGESVEKYFNHLSIVASIVGGICVSFLGGMDQLLDVLLFLMIVDFVTGWLKAIA